MILKCIKENPEDNNKKSSRNGRKKSNSWRNQPSLVIGLVIASSKRCHASSLLFFSFFFFFFNPFLMILVKVALMFSFISWKLFCWHVNFFFFLIWLLEKEKEKLTIVWNRKLPKMEKTISTEEYAVVILFCCLINFCLNNKWWSFY